MCRRMKASNEKIIIWGTGGLFQRYKEYLSQFSIVKFCDSDKKKQGNFINGIEIISPDEIVKYEYTYIVIMAYMVSEIYPQLVDMNVPDEKILTYNQIFILQNQPILIQSAQGEIVLDEWKKQNSRAVLLLSHEFSYSGAPVALKNMALIIKDMGYSVLMAAEVNGSFITELKMLGLDYLEDVDLFYGTECFKEMLSHFAVIVVGTFALYRIVKTWDEVNVPILWWIHETYEPLYEGRTILPQNSNIKYLAGGNRVKRVFEAHYPHVKMEKLQYCIPDTAREVREEKSHVITVAAIGAINQRKAQDVLLEAINMLPAEYRHKFEFILIGKIISRDQAFIDLIQNEMAGIDHLEWFEELSQEELDLYYEHIDVLVCASRDDPMPIVVTQAMMHRKTCIVSDEVGQAEFIIPKKNGLIFKSEDKQALKEALVWVADNKEQLTKLGRNAKGIYDREFSEEVMREKLSAIFQKIICTGN